MKLTNILNFYLATAAFSSATDDENKDPAIGGLRGNRESFEKERILNPATMCGFGEVGNGNCPNDNECCSKHGYCGTTENHCNNPAIMCGNGEVGNGICPNNDECCSKHGYCGTTENHCNTHIYPDRLCGEGMVGNGYCPNYECCSKWGYCGTTDAHCQDSAPGFFPTLGEYEEPNCGNGKVGNGRCANGNFCSLHGYCGNLEDAYKKPAPNANLELFYEAAFMSRMAYFVFSNSNDKTKRSANCKGPNGELMDPCHQHEGDIDAVLVAKYRNKCFVSFRGTLSPWGVMKKYKYDQWKRDIKQNNNLNEAKNRDGCKYRKGFHNAYMSMREKIGDSLDVCQSKCGKLGCEVVLTGHSKGGAAAIAASFDTSFYKSISMRERFNDPFVITFGAPPFATTQSECEDSINLKKHFRIVNSMKHHVLACDPIAEHSVKQFETKVGKAGSDFFFKAESNDNFKERTFHVGNVVLLNRDGDNSFQIAQGSGDVTCQDFSPGDTQNLDRGDFERKNDVNNYRYREEPLHAIGTYHDRLEKIHGGKPMASHEVRVIDGFNKDHACTKNWQCAGDMVCNSNNMCA